MRIGNPLLKRLNEYFDLTFFIRFILILLAFYYTYLICISIAKPDSRIHNEFLSNNFHFGNWIRITVLQVANQIDHLFGLDSYIVNGKSLRVVNGRGVLMARQCLGLEIMGFWVAFVVAHSSSWQRKLLWCFAGVGTIWFINCWRVALLLIALQNNWATVQNIDHHALFNIVAYAFILLLVWRYYKSNKEEAKNTIAAT